MLERQKLGSIKSFENNDVFTSLFPIFMLPNFYFLIALSRISKAMLKDYSNSIL